MSDVAISVQGLGKRFRLSHRAPRRTLREDVLSLPRRLAGWAKRDRTADEEFWALRDVSFEVKRGEVLGVIGRNGAGKSTLLKILSRVLEPTCGEALINGRIGSLLEVGTGFHPELTGRENIFLSGALLGMRRDEIVRRFDEIVSFAGIEKFLDTPCKHYSSGMYTRLGFAVAAHMETEILLLDEVLAVGDAEFQKRCLRKVNEVAKSGRTVLFVSHHMAALRQLCSSGIVLNRGAVYWFGDDVAQAISNYHTLTCAFSDSKSEWRCIDEAGSPYFSLRTFRVVNEDGTTSDGLCGPEQRIWLEVAWDCSDIHPGLSVGYALRAESDEVLLWSFHTDDEQAAWPAVRLGRNLLRTELPRRLLNEGVYRVELLASLHPERWLYPPGGGGPHILLTLSGLTSKSPLWTVRRPGSIAPLYKWNADTAC